jgi:hypothetical protein
MIAQRLAGNVDVLRLLAEDKGGRDAKGRPMYLSDEDLGYDQYGMVESPSIQEIADHELELRQILEALSANPDYRYVDPSGQGPEYLKTPETKRAAAEQIVRIASYLQSKNLVPNDSDMPF